MRMSLFIPGSTFERGGTLLNASNLPFPAGTWAGWDGECYIRVPDENGKPVDGPPLADTDFSINDDGVCLATVPHTETIDWPENAELLIDVLLISPAGSRYVLPMQVFKTGYLVTNLP